MRNILFKRLPGEMRKDQSLFFLMGDTGFNLVEPVFNEFPDRSMNVGIAEQNLIGIAAGLVNAGYRPICYAISNFLVHRALEQTRNDLCLHDYPAILLGTSAGFDNGALWATHYAVDDIGCLKPLPNIQIYSPSSIESMHASFDEILKQSHPAYMRIGKSEYSDSIAPPKPNRFAIEEKRAKVLVITHGKMLLNSLEAVKMLSGKTSVFAMDRIKPLDSALLKKLFTAYPQIIVVENNFNSGLYNSLCQWVMENGIVPKALVSIAPKEDYGKTTGNVAWLEGWYGLTATDIAKHIKKIAA
ncbi:MAG TPA: transketolase C-terminal domain-containing protein [Candidatus Paceibacterota bacterium]